MARKTTEERIVLLEAQIQKKQDEIAVLEAKKQKLLHPVTMKAVISKAKEAGLTPEEVADKLGLEV